MKNDSISLARAYAQGYWDGRSIGNDRPWDGYTDLERHFYNMGYESGVADYCRFDAPDATEVDDPEL